MPAAAADAAHGKSIYMQNCASCHGATANGGVGPALKGEKSRKNMAQAIAWIKHPQPPMPKLYPSPLSEKDVRDVAAYVESL
jgi:alcohol dehydrogenase (cytochrome c)